MIESSAKKWFWLNYGHYVILARYGFKKQWRNGSKPYATSTTSYWWLCGLLKVGERKEVFVILNELIGLMSQQVIEEVISSIECANRYALIAVEATDTPTRSSFAVIRWVDNDNQYVIHKAAN